jgi:hypothetical protein
MSSSHERIYVRLLNEGVDVWRPVQAVREGADYFRSVGPTPQPEGEEWEFPLGSVVGARPFQFEGGNGGLVAEALPE